MSSREAAVHMESLYSSAPSSFLPVLRRRERGNSRRWRERVLVEEKKEKVAKRSGRQRERKQ